MSSLYVDQMGEGVKRHLHSYRGTGNTASS